MAGDMPGSAGINESETHRQISLYGFIKLNENGYHLRFIIHHSFG